MTVRRGGSSCEAEPLGAGRILEATGQKRLRLQCPWRQAACEFFSASGLYQGAPSSFLVTLVSVRGAGMNEVGRKKLR